MRGFPAYRVLCCLVLIAAWTQADDRQQPVWITGSSTLPVSVVNSPSISNTSFTVTGSTVSVIPWVSTAAVMSMTVAISTTPIQVASLNLRRKGFVAYNPSTTAIYVAYDVTANVTSHLTFSVAPATSWVMPNPIYQGPIAAVRAATGDGKLLVTEMQ